VAYGVKYRATHNSNTGQTSTKYEIEILEKNFSGTLTEVKGHGPEGIFKLNYDKIDIEDPYSDPIQKGRLEFFLSIGGSTSYDGVAILDEIFHADESEYRLRLKKNGTVVWTGSVLGDLLKYPEGKYTYSGTIVAKDLTRLSGFDFPLVDQRKRIIDTISRILKDLGYGLDIYTYTSWTEDNISSSDDYLNQIYNDEKAFRQFANNGDETDQPITNEKALEQILKNHGLILRQEDNAWRLYQLSALEDPTSVDWYRYDSTGTQQASGTSDLTVDIESIDTHIKPGSTNNFISALQEAKARFEHRTTVSNIQFPSSVIVSGNQTKDFTQYINTDGTQNIVLGGDISAKMTSSQETATASIALGAAGYWWDDINNKWTGSFTYNNVDLTSGHIDPDYRNFIGSVDYTTENLPSDADGTLTVRFRGALGETISSEETFYGGWEISVLNASVEEGNNTAIEYELIQSGDYSKKYETDKLWFGDGPTGYSPGALSTDASGSTLTNDSWKRKGAPSSSNFFNVLLSELIDTQRSTNRNLEADIRGQYSSTDLISYSGSNLFFMGGSLTGQNNEWDADFLEYTVKTGSDVFNVIYKNSDEGESGGGSATQSSTTDGGVSFSTGDSRWVNVTGDVISGKLSVNDVLSANKRLDVDDIRIDGNVISSTSGDITINPAGNLYISGDTIEIDKELTTTDNTVVLNSGESGSGVTAGSSGIEVDRGSLPYYKFMFRESDDAFVIGKSGSLQTVATRQNSPVNQGVAYWNGSLNRFDTNSSLTFNGSQLSLPTLSSTGNVIVGGVLDLQSGKLINLNEIEGRGDDKIEIYNASGASNSRTYLELYGNESGKVGQAHLGGNSIHFFTGVTDSSVGSNDITFNSNGTATFRNDLIYHTKFTSDDYTSGILGAGSILDNDASGGSFFEVDNMRVRNEFRAHIFMKDVLRVSNGQRVGTDSAQVHEDVTLSDNTAGQTIKIDSGLGNATFSVGDLIWAKSMSDDGGTIYGVKAEITSIDTSPSDHTVLTVDTSNGGNGGSIKDGDVIARVSGGYLFEDASSQYSPFYDVYDGVSTWTDFQSTDKLKARYGNLAGAPNLSDGTSPSGYGLYSENIFLEGTIVTDNGRIGGWTINSSNITGGNLTLNSSGQIVNSTQINSTNAYQLNNDGSGHLAGGEISWSNTGNVTFGSSVTLSWSSVTDDGSKPADNADVTSNNTAANISGQGALATQNDADWQTQVTGTGKPSDNATVGADWNSNLSNIPTNLDSLGDIPTYINSTSISSTTITSPTIAGNNGVFNGYIAVNASSPMIIGSDAGGSGNHGIYFSSNGDHWYDDERFQVGGSNGISYTGSGNVQIGTGADFAGTLTAPDGNISGWTINTSNLTSPDGSTAEIHLQDASETRLKIGSEATLPSTVDLSFESDPGGTTVAFTGGGSQTNTASDFNSSVIAGTFNTSKQVEVNWSITDNSSSGIPEWSVKIQGYNGSSWEDVPDTQISGAGDSSRTQYATLSDYEDGRLILTVSARKPEDDTNVSLNYDSVKQYDVETVINKYGIFSRLSPNTVKALGDSAGGSELAVPVSSVFGRTGDITAQSGDYSISQISNANPSNWDTAYIERGSQIAGTNLSWDGSQLNATTGTDTNYYLTGLSFDTGNGVLTATVNGASNVTEDLDGRYYRSGDSANFNMINLSNHEIGDYSTGGDIFHDESAGLYVVSSNIGGSGAALCWTSDNFSAGSNLSVSYDSEDEPTLSVVNSPTFSGQVTWGSDIRLKDNITSIKDSSEILKQLNGRRYTRNDREGEAEIGFIAQEVNRILPEAIRIPENEDEMWSMNTVPITAHLVEGFKDHESRIDKLEKENARLRERLRNHGITG